MILQSLCELAGREGLVDDPDFEPKDVRWIIHLRPGGHLASLENTDTSIDGKTWRPRSMSVPRGVTNRTSKSIANFLVDKAEYVLGLDPDDSPNKRGKLALHNSLFAKKIESALSISPEEHALCAVRAFLESAEEKSRCIEALAGRVASNDLFAFSFRPDAESDATRVHDRPAVRSAWRQMRGEKPTGSTHTCLVCGNDRQIADSHPVIKLVPGGSGQGIRLVSFNPEASLSFGLEGNDNAPICRDCAEAYTTALNRLFHPEYPRPGTREFLPRRSFRLSDDTAVIFWASAEHPFVDEFGDVAYADEAKVESLYQAVHVGGRVRLDDPTAFHALIVTGGQGRATLRGYHRTSVGVVAEALRQYFDDVDIVPRFPKAPRHLALRWLIRSLAPRGKDENVDPNLAGDLFLAILNGRPFPTSVLHAALRRIRHEPERPEKGEYKHTRERMALIRASLNRRLRAGDPILTHLLDGEISTMLDESCTSPGYCLGRLFAVLEKLQADAIGKPNASIADRFYGSASATPAAVFGTLLRKAQHHLSKDGRGHYRGKIEAILTLLDPATAFPPALGLEEQGLFALGYYHQRADLWKGKEAAVAEEPLPVPVEA